MIRYFIPLIGVFLVLPNAAHTQSLGDIQRQNLKSSRDYDRPIREERFEQSGSFARPSREEKREESNDSWAPDPIANMGRQEPSYAVEPWPGSEEKAEPRRKQKSLLQILNEFE